MNRLIFVGYRSPACLAASLLLGLISLGSLAGCDDSFTQDDLDNTRLNTPVRLALSAGHVWFSTAGETASISAEVRLFGPARRAVDGDIIWTSSDPSVATVADGVITAIGDGRATITASAEGVSGSVAVTVQRDVLQARGFAGPTAAIDLFTVSSSTLAGVDTGIDLGGMDSFGGGVADVETFGDHVYAIGSFPAPDYDTVYKLDPATGGVLGTLELFDAGLGIDSSSASAASLEFVSPTRAYVSHRTPDGNGDYYLSEFNPRTMELTGRIVVPVQSNDPYLGDMLAFGRYLFIVDLRLSQSTFQFSPSQIIVLDWIDGVGVDVDPSTQAFDVLQMSDVNAQLTISPSGRLYGVCTGDGFAGDWMSLEFWDLASWTQDGTVNFEDGATGGSMAWAPDGRLYIASQYANEIVTVDGLRDAILRDHTNRIDIPGESGIPSLGISARGRVVMSAWDFVAVGHHTRGFDIADDDNSSALATIDGDATALPPGSLAVFNETQPAVFASEVIASAGIATNSLATDALGAPSAVNGNAPTTAAVLGAENAEGSIVLGFGNRRIVDRPGPDFVVFGGATLAANPPGRADLWRDVSPGRIEVSSDGIVWTELAATIGTGFTDVEDPRRYTGAWFGITPTTGDAGTPPYLYSAGGDRIDLASADIESCRYIRLTGEAAIVDAIAALHTEQD